MLFTGLILFSLDKIDFSAFLIGVILLMSSYGPVIALSNLSSNLLQTLASGERVLSLLAEEPELKDVESAVDLKDVSRIDVENVSFAYGEEQILSDVSLSVKKGEILGIHGRSGSGKSTLAKHFNVLLQPSEGHVNVCGFDTRDEAHIWDIRQHVGMVFQNPDNQIVAAVVEEDVAFGPENLGIPSDEIRKRVDAALEAVNMTEYREHGPHLLSGGQKQRIAIAGVLAMKPDCIVLDEPTAMLDPKRSS